MNNISQTRAGTSSANRAREVVEYAKKTKTHEAVVYAEGQGQSSQLDRDSREGERGK